VLEHLNANQPEDGQAGDQDKQQQQHQHSPGLGVEPPRLSGMDYLTRHRAMTPITVHG
jgi:hypothetical protein